MNTLEVVVLRRRAAGTNANFLERTDVLTALHMMLVALLVVLGANGTSLTVGKVGSTPFAP